MENNRSQSKLNKIFFALLILLILGLGWLNIEPYVAGWRSQIDEFLARRPVPPILEESSVTERQVVKEESAVIDVVESASPAVVSVVARTVTFSPFNGPSAEESSIGTGFIFDSSGLILTNKHVVPAGATERYRVVLKDGTDYPVVEIHRDPFLDLAILKIDPPEADLPTLEFGDSDELKVGQTAIAIGNALGKFTNTVTVGVISGIGRGVTASSGFGRSEVLDDVIQTDAALNPGNSGGPLLNLSGQVIGVNVATTSGAENIGFSIPINAAKSVIKTYQEKGKIVRPFLGVEYVIITEDMSVLRDLPQGAFIQRVVEGTPAEEAGLKAGDIIVAVDGKEIKESNTLAQVIRGHKVGDSLKLTVDRNGQEIDLTATLGEAPNE